MFQLKWTKSGWLFCCGECGYQSLGEDKKIETGKNKVGYTKEIKERNIQIEHLEPKLKKRRRLES